MSTVLASPDSVREELQRILESPPFASAARSRRFLSYVVERTLAGQSEAIKELVLASEVFDRPADFDPRVDTIVRVEAGKLRKRIEEYYSSTGMPRDVRIDIPKGSYVPRFEAVAASAAPSVERDSDGDVVVRSRRRLILAAAIAGVVVAVAGVAIVSSGRSSKPVVNAPAVAIAVLQFQNFSPDPNNSYLANGLAEDLTDALAQIPGLRVASRTSAFAFEGQQVDVREIGSRLGVGYVIEGSVRREGDRLKVSAQLVRTDDGYHVWSRSFERDVRDVLAVQGELARSVVDSVQVKLASTTASAAEGRTCRRSRRSTSISEVSTRSPEPTRFTPRNCCSARLPRIRCTRGRTWR